jgi:hypothetical protein
MVAAELADRSALLDAFGTGLADLVIVDAVDHKQAARPLRFLVKSPGVKVLMLGTSGRCAVMYNFRLQRTPLGDVSPRRLLDTVSQHDRPGQDR